MNKVFFLKFILLFSVLSLLLMFLLPACTQKDDKKTASNFTVIKDDETLHNMRKYVVKVNRPNRKLTINDVDDHIITEADVGLGRGGLKQKRTMSDNVTPTGEFTVDIILYTNSDFNKIEPKLKEKYMKSEFNVLVKDRDGLKQLFLNMNGLDFNSDGMSDNSYGIAYIGLQSVQGRNNITGPKLRYTDWKGAAQTPYWYSIAIHGTPDEEGDIGSSNSGGCVHLSKNMLSGLIEREIISIGTKVIIED